MLHRFIGLTPLMIRCKQNHPNPKSDLMSTKPSCDFFKAPRIALSTAILISSALSGGALPIITDVVETGGDNDPDDTVTAKWTGVTWSNHQPNEPVPGLAAGAPYTVGLFGHA